MSKAYFSAPVSALSPVREEAGQPSGGAPGLSGLPRWDLSDLYEGPQAPQLATDLDQADADSQDFARVWQGRLASVPGGELAQAIAEYQRIDEVLGRAGSYAQLLFAANTSDSEVARFAQSVNERLTAISTHLLFFTLEINRIPDDVLAAQMSDPALAHWAPFLRDLRVFRPYQLPDEVEAVLHEKSVTGPAAWNRLFDETMAGLRVRVGGESLTLGNALDTMSSPDRSVRASAARAIGDELGRNVKLFSLITNTLAKDKAIMDGLRHYPRPTSARNCANMVEDEVVDALVQAVTEAYPRLSHRYYALKAKWLGLEKLEYWDRNAPLTTQDEPLIGWKEATGQVLGAYEGFDPRMGKVAKEFFDHAWIDAPPVPGKASGAFAHPTVPSVHPYLLLNYRGRTRDVMTLAHELGHGVHQVLAGRQGYLMSSTPLTLAETASVFGEMLTFRALLDAQTDPTRRRLMLAAKVEDMLNTVVRQVAFYRFETLVHEERRKGELLPARIGEIWRQTQAESLGPAFNFTPDYDVYWTYVPHFIHSPFYVYAYAFGDCLVNALYGVFRSGHPGFQDKYLDMLAAGGTKRHRELLAPFGLDAADPGFWQKGLDVIAGFIDELERV
ncbi:Oligoendopeptidase F-like protein [Gluconacetobacter sp. SXCC-1]|uniref:M3 family oligoendopeptidase n=1 Tax=Komagataeibacter rhaeticus TaxID=215221 RepID=A0A181C898_9PROT|nr:M3 family oligoendopeptidase [Komagataeibacter rhaeticus]ATU73455.1 oligoendopeptidase F [Komagataeibacter xylinus]EGG75953.1 Oligoendopeptidase F-like protein [Gluconacetobacter sp. SXCC-1]QIP34710.1 M3 family oligoendopeptidase [Komagataeibacter rhaeticus]QOC47237.1 M3 family oligoendopeptidase [Komagataeibacter rhaeticus]WPP23366.1 M3 family oligoendopeptidase [Komagataeibacter rhaeticus]